MSQHNEETLKKYSPIVDDLYRTNINWMQKYGDDNVLSKIVLKKMEDGSTLLHWAVDAHNVECVKKLIELGACVNSTSNDQVTPIHFCRSVEVAELLINAGADINAKDSAGSTVVVYAFVEEHYELCDFLVKKLSDADFEAMKKHLNISREMTRSEVIQLMANGVLPERIINQCVNEMGRPPRDEGDIADLVEKFRY